MMLGMKDGKDWLEFVIDRTDLSELLQAAKANLNDKALLVEPVAMPKTIEKVA